MPVVYILKFRNSGRYYIGSTSDLIRRVKQHKEGHTGTSRRLGEFEVVFTQETETLGKARQMEKKIKSWKRRDFIEKIIREGKIKISG